MEDFLKHLILYEIQRAKVCPYRLLFEEEFLDDLKKSEEFIFSNIYFFCRQKKVRFNLDKTKLLNKRTLQTELIIGDKKRKKVTTNFFDLSGIFRSIYPTKEEYNELVSDDDDFWDCEFAKDESDDTLLQFYQINTKDNQRFSFLISPENFEYDLDLDLNNSPEIVYIGQSFRMLDRIQSHKTLHKAVSKLKSTEELKILFLTFKFGYGGHKDFFKFQGDVFNVWLSEHSKNENFKSKIDLVERFLIHFFKPIYNRQHVNCEIQEDKIVKELLVKNEVETVSVNYGMYGNGFQFWTPRQKLKSEVCTFNFKKPKKGYYEGIEEK